MLARSLVAAVVLAGAVGCEASVLGPATHPIDAALIDAPVVPDGPPVAKGTPMIYVGAGDDHIHVLAIDEATLALTPRSTVATGAGPSFLAFDARSRWLVTVNEGGDAIESFAIAPTTGELSRIHGASSHGAGPAHVSLDRSGAWVLIANYGDGTAAVVPITPEGSFGSATATVAPGANAHQIVTDAANQIVYVPCLGANDVVVYAFDVGKGTLSNQGKTPGTSPASAGPRHIAIAPDGAHAWVINEKASSITTYALGAGGKMTEGDTVSSRKQGATGDNTGAEIAVHPSGKWLYVSNRGDNTIGVFAISAAGALTAQQHISTGGAKPRHFSLVLEGTALLVANQDGNTIVGYHLDPQTGALTSVGTIANITGPQFVGQLRLPQQ